jgi:hypothetical protein
LLQAVAWDAGRLAAEIETDAGQRAHGSPSNE